MTASVPGSVGVVFTVTILPPGSSPIPHPSGIGRIVWQGSSTMTSGTPFVATVWKSGVPAAGATVNVAVTEGPAELLNGAGAVVDQLSLITESDGTLAFDAQFPINGTSPDDFSIITLTAQNGGSAVFLVHALPSASPPAVEVAGPGNQAFPVVDGSPSSVPVTLTLQSAGGAPLYGVTAAIMPGTDSTASCSEAVPITDENGAFSCHLIVAGKAGIGSLGFVLGTMAVSPSIAYSISPAGAGLIRILSGNFQSGPNGHRLPIPLSVQLLDAYGNAVPGSPLAWQSSTATIVNANSTTDTSGTASAVIQLGPKPGPQKVTVGASGLSAQFELTDTSLGQLTVSSGNGQIANVGQAFGTPLAVRAAGAVGQPISNRTVVFSVPSGAARLDQPVVETDADGTASVKVKAGSFPGMVTVEAATGGDRVDFVLSALPPAALSVALSDWNGRSAAVTPGALMNVSFVSAGRNEYDSMSFPGPPYPTAVQGLTVSFDGVPAPILRLSGIGATTELLVQIPWELSGRETVRLLLSTGSAANLVDGLVIEQFHPAIRAKPAILSPIETLAITGIGQFAPLASTNSAGIPSQSVAGHFALSIDGIRLPILSIAADPKLVGVADVTVVIPFAARRRLTSMSEISVSAQ